MQDEGREVRSVEGEQSHKIWGSGRKVERGGGGGVGTRAEATHQGNLFHSGRDMMGEGAPSPSSS